MRDINWEDKVKGLLKAELVRRNLNHQDLVGLLNEAGIPVTKASIDTKLSRGTFSAAFLIQCLSAIGCNEIRVSTDGE